MRVLLRSVRPSFLGFWAYSLLFVGCGILLSGCTATQSEERWVYDIQQGCKIEQKYSYEYAYEMSWDGDCDVDTGEAYGRGTIRWVEPNGQVGFARTCLRPQHRLSNCGMGSGL